MCYKQNILPSFSPSRPYITDKSTVENFTNFFDADRQSHVIYSSSRIFGIDLMLSKNILAKKTHSMHITTTFVPPFFLGHCGFGKPCSDPKEEKFMQTIDSHAVFLIKKDQIEETFFDDKEQLCFILP